MFQMLDVKLGTHFPSGYPVSRSPPLFLRASPGPEPYRPRDHQLEHEHEPVYEELPAPPPLDSADSDGDFAGDELSLAGELPPAPCISTIHRERRRGGTGTARRAPRHAHHAQFHEGLLLDALLRLYPNVGTVGHAAAARGGAWGGPQRRGGCVPCAPCAPPYVPCATAAYAPCGPCGPCAPTTNATACSRDSLGSDSGYSNTTRASSRNRRDLNFS